MIRRRIITFATTFLGLAFLSGSAIAEQKSLTQQIIGTWTLSAFYRECPDGNKSDVLGPNPQGLRIFQSDGRMSNFVLRSDLHKFASNKPQEGTADENKAVVQGAISFVLWKVFSGRLH